MQSLKSILEKHKASSRVAMQYMDKKITYKEWNIKSKKVASMLDSFANKSSVAAIYIHNSIDYAYAYFGILMSNKTIIPIDIRTSSTEMLRVFEFCSINLILSVKSYQQQLLSIFANITYDVIIYYVDDDSYEISNGYQCIEHDISVCENGLNDSDIALMINTSGTTSVSKVVMLSHENVLSNIYANIEALGIREDDKSLIALPMCFSYCNTAQFLSHVAQGACLIIMDGLFFPKRFFELISIEKITNFFAVPSIMMSILSYHYIDKYDYSSLKMICIGGAKMPEDKYKIAIQRIPNIQFVTTYGLTEASPRVSSHFVSTGLPAFE